MLERYQRYTTKITNIAELNTVSLTIWDDWPQEFTDKTSTLVAAAGEHSENAV